MRNSGKWRTDMFGPLGPVRITLGTVVLDSPDRSGRYIAQDMVGGWAYLIADRAGDTWARSQGGCPGGLDVQLRCAFLLAASQVPDSRHITILVETRQAHRAMVALARQDVHVITAIAGRPVSVTTRPDERSSFQVRAAAERAAGVMLRDREEASHLERPPLKELPSYASEGSDSRRADGEEAGPAAPSRDTAAEGRSWRPGSRAAAPATNSEAKVSPATSGSHTAASSSTRQPVVQNPGLSNWLREFNKRVAAISEGGMGENR